MPTAIEFENVGKQYRLGLVSTRTLSHDLERWWTMNVLRKEDPYLKIGDTNDRSVKGSSEYVWALKDINFKVEQGDVVGIIGRNGAGKSTLLKLLSKVTGPTTGVIRARGRIGSLLEVGTGFHQEMTGRENIFMNGAILGMTKAEVARKLDEIVDFSGCERYLDTPVKRYSSGMMVRLGFAVAAHLDPEILVVDEVLAVGDAEFQKKAIGKMQDVSRGEGRTVLFVSHNMTSIKNLCKTGILLENGTVKKTGEINSVVNDYLNNQIDISKYKNRWKVEDILAPGREGIHITGAGIEFETNTLTVHSDFCIYTEFFLDKDFCGLMVSMHLCDPTGAYVFAVPSSEKNLNKGYHRVEWKIPKDFMNNGPYYVNNFFYSAKENYSYWHKQAVAFEINEERESFWYGTWVGAVRPLGIIKVDYD